MAPPWCSTAFRRFLPAAAAEVPGWTTAVAGSATGVKPEATIDVKGAMNVARPRMDARPKPTINSKTSSVSKKVRDVATPPDLGRGLCSELVDVAHAVVDNRSIATVNSTA